MLAVLKIGAAVCSGVFLIWFLIPIRYHMFKAGNILGVFLCLLMLFRTVFATAYHKLEALMLAAAWTKALWIAAHLLFYAFCVYAAVVSLCMVIAMKSKPEKGAPAVILGAQVKPWGASRMLRQRISAAERYLKQFPDAIAVASGGKGDNEPISESACIRENMIHDGFSPERILSEDRSVNTEQNILYSLCVLKERGAVNHIAIVSDSYHQLRARIITRKLDRHIGVGAYNTKNTLVGVLFYPSYFVREWIAIPVEIVKKPGRPARHRKL